MEERTQEYYMCGGDLRKTEVDSAPFPGFVTYEEAARKYALVQRENEELREQVAHQQRETEKWRQLYSVSRHQASRALDMLNSAKVQIEVLENKLNGRK